MVHSSDVTHFQYGVVCQGERTGTPCNEGKPIELDRSTYLRQLDDPDAVWSCPVCKGKADWDEQSGASQID